MVGAGRAWLSRYGGNFLLITVTVAVELLGWGGAAVARWGGMVPVWVVPLGAALAYSTLAWRGRHLRAVFLVIWTYSLLGLALPEYEPFAGLVVALYFVARGCPRRAALRALAACALPVAINTLDVATANAQTVLAQLGVGLFAGSLWSATYVGVWLVGRKHREGVKAAAAAAEAAARVELEAQQRTERLRLARELHDIVAHSVSAIILQAAGAKTLATAETTAADTDDRIAAALGAIESTGVQAMRELHRLLGLLRAAAGDTQAGVDPSAATLAHLEELLALTRLSGIDVRLQTVGETAPLDPSVDLAAYRMIQESLANVMKHAGRGARADVTLSWHPEIVDVIVRSTGGTARQGSGAGGEFVSSGLGLRGLRERIEAVGGRFDAGAIAGGYLTHAHLPLAGSAPAAPARGTDPSPADSARHG